VGAVIELKPLGQFWQVTRDGNVIACAVTRQGAIDAAATLLHSQLADPVVLAGMQFVGLTTRELLPAKPAEPSPKPLPSKINFTDAKRLVTERWLPLDAKRVGTAVAIADELCLEYEWGWVIYWRPVDPEKGDPRFVNEYHFPYTADRVTGTVELSGGTFGIQRGIVELLQQRPPELCGPYPPGRRHWLAVYNAFEAAGAFTPRGPAIGEQTPAEPDARPNAASDIGHGTS
jgi:hypothetical protein